MVYTNNVQLSRPDLCIYCVDQLVRVDSFFEEVEIPSSITESLSEYFYSEVTKIKDTMRGMIEKHGAGIFEIATVNMVSVKLTVYSAR